MEHESGFADRLKELRKSKGYTQDDVASALGIVRQTYSHYETGKRKPDVDTFNNLAAFYGISKDAFFDYAVDTDRNLFFDAPEPTPDSLELAALAAFYSKPENQKKFRYFSNAEKELLFFFSKLTREDQDELIEFAKIKARKQKPRG